MADVFVSYSMKTAGEVVRRIVETLERDGISCWYADEDMELGVAFMSAATRAIDQCKIFLAVLNKEAFCSAHVAAEFALAFQRYNQDNKQIRLIPFVVSRADFAEMDNPNYDSIRYCTALFSRIDGVPPDDAHIRALAGKIREALEAFALT